MRKQLPILISTCALIAAAVVFFTKPEASSQNLVLANIEAITSGEEGTTGTTTCYSKFSECWFWNCSTIYRCAAPCETAKSDSESESGKCTL